MAIIPNSTTDHSSNRAGQGMVYEIGRTQILMTGGKDITKSSILATSAPIDTWHSTNDGTTWSQLSPTASPSHRFFHAMAYSNDDGYSFIHGGLDSIGVQFTGDLWYFNNTTWAQFATTFTPQVNAPSSRFAHEMISLDGYNGLVLFGGIGTTLINHQEYLQDTWLFSTSTKLWTQITSTFVPPARAYFGMAFDGYNAIITGGEQNGQYLSDMWKFNASSHQWTSVAQGSTIPSARKGHSLVWDNFNKQLILFGGSTVNYGLSNETWAFKNGAWSLLTTATHPTRRYNASMVFDSGNNTIVLMGGTGLDGAPLGDVATFNCTTQTWSIAGDYQSAQTTGPVSDH